MKAKGAFLLLSAALLAACGQVPTQQPAPVAEAPPTPPSLPHPPYIPTQVRPCGVVTEAQARAILGGPVKATDSTVYSRSSCHYENPRGLVRVDIDGNTDFAQIDLRDDAEEYRREARTVNGSFTEENGLADEGVSLVISQESNAIVRLSLRKGSENIRVTAEVRGGNGPAILAALRDACRSAPQLRKETPRPSPTFR